MGGLEYLAVSNVHKQDELLAAERQQLEGELKRLDVLAALAREHWGWLRRVVAGEEGAESQRKVLEEALALVLNRRDLRKAIRDARRAAKALVNLEPPREPEPEPEERYLTVPELAARLQLRPDTVEYALLDPGLPRRRGAGGEITFSEAHARAWQRALLSPPEEPPPHRTSELAP